MTRDKLIGLEHKSDKPYVFVKDKETIEIRLRVPKTAKVEVSVHYNDPYNYKEDRWMKKEKELELLCSDDMYNWYTGDLKIKTRRFSYTFVLKGGKDIYYFNESGLTKHFDTKYNFNLPYSHEIDIFHYPKWVEKTIWYQIFPDRFNRSQCSKIKREWHRGDVQNHEIYGGNLRGITQKLSYLKKLGITGLYFTPIFKADTSHKYDTVDYFKLDKQFGSEEDLRELIQKAHQKGIKIMLDGVFNHMSSQNEIFQDVIKNKKGSKYYDWFYINKVEDIGNYNKNKSVGVQKPYEAFAYCDNMPKLNTENPEVKNYLFKAIEKWTKFGIDGWRLDVANEVDHEFWKDFRKLVRGINPDIYVLGEIWHDSEVFLRGDEFDAVMNYKYTNNIMDYFVYETIDIIEFKEKTFRNIMQYESAVQRATFNLLDSHDTPRIKHLCEGDLNKQILAVAFMFLQMGSPCIYYGSELGLDGAGDPDNRRLMHFENNPEKNDYHTFYSQLTKIRKKYASLLNYGDYNFTDDENLVILKRKYKKIELIAVFNNTDKDLTYKASKEVVYANNYKQGKILSKGVVIYEVPCD